MQADGAQSLREAHGETVFVTPGSDEPVAAPTDAEIDTDEDGTLTEDELNALTVAQLKAYAAEKGITLTATKKAEIIAEILTALADTPGGG